MLYKAFRKITETLFLCLKIYKTACQDLFKFYWIYFQCFFYHLKNRETDASFIGIKCKNKFIGIKEAL